MPEITQKDLEKIKTYSLRDRKSLVTRKEFGIPVSDSDSLQTFLQGLPKTYMAKDLMSVADQLLECHTNNRVRHFSLGSHVIKNGLSPYLIDLMKRGLVTTLSFNGSALVHDFEISEVGATSEDVDEALGSGAFGVAKETAENINEAIKTGVKEGFGIGKSLGLWIQKNSKFPESSLFATALEYGVNTTVHVAIGTDIVHIHPSFDAAAMGLGSHRDFLLFASSVSELEGGIYFNLGSAVILPEVFLKAISLARNLGHKVENFCAVNFDFIRHYRPRRNVLDRPTRQGGKAVEIVGPHEILIPLLHAALVCRSR